MSFHRSSTAFEVIGGQLCADCRNKSGNYCSSFLDLDLYLGNRNGSFEWGGKNFSRSARDIHFVNNGSSFVLHATLCTTRDGVWKEAKTNLSDYVANHDGKLAYVGSLNPFGEFFENDPFSATMSGIKDFAQDLTESLFGLPSPRAANQENSTRRNSRPQHPDPNRSEAHVPNGNSEKDSAASKEISPEEALEFEEASTPVPENKHKEAFDSHTLSEEETSLNELSAEQQEEFQYELVMRTIKKFLLQGPGATVTSNITKDGQRELVFSRGEENFTLLASKIRPEILFDQDEYRRSWSGDSSVARCLTPETVEGEDDDTVLI